jgi:hypothetical protein
MLRRTALLTLAPLALMGLAAAASLQGQTPPANPVPKKTTFVTIQGNVLIKATPANVWQVLTASDGIAILTGATGVETGKTLAKVGDALPATAWKDGGNLVATFLLKEKELRMAFEPNSAAYLAQHRAVLEPGSTGGTVLSVFVRYTDDKTDNVDRTIQTLTAELAAHLEAFRVRVEMP